MIKGMQEVIDTVARVKETFENNGGLKQIVFVACGGSLSSSYPARYMLNAESSTLRVLGYNSSEFVHATPKFVGKNTLVIATSTKATQETVEALETANAKGAVTIGLTGYSNSATAQTAQYSLTYYHSDDWYQDPTLVHCNSQGTALKLAFVLLKEFEGYAAYDKAMAAFEKLPTIYAKAYQDIKPVAVEFAMRYQNDEIWNALASGAMWECAYSDAFCFFQEIQTVHCVPCHSGEYFHGAFETTDRNLAVLLMKSVGRTRALDERAERFLEQFGGHHFILDAKELGLDQLDGEVAEYFNALLVHPITKQLIAALGDVRMHPMSYRRYMWKFNY